MNEKEQFKHLYQLYLSNSCTAEELKHFFDLLEKRRDDQELMALLSDTWDQTALSPEQGLTPPFLPQERKTVQLWRRLVSAAAVLLILSGLYLYRSDLSRLVAPAPAHQLLTATAERKLVNLPDGTRVWLSPNSKLGYPENFEGTERNVTLDGEAFFEVTHDARHPFVIKSGQVSTTVLGTSFNVTAYTQQNTINVTLVTGKVAVALQGQNTTRRDTIVANQRIIVDKAASSISKVDYPDAAAFLNKRLGLYEYRGAALGEVIRDLENQYGIQIKTDSSLAESTFYGNLKMTDPLTETLNKLSTVMEAQWKKEGTQYIILKY